MLTFPHQSICLKAGAEFYKSFVPAIKATVASRNSTKVELTKFVPAIKATVASSHAGNTQNTRGSTLKKSNSPVDTENPTAVHHLNHKI